MPHHKSTIKRIRQDKKRQARNQAVRSAVRSAVKKADSAGNAEEAGELLRQASSVIDRAAKKRIIHWKTAARKKSRLARRVRTRSS